MSRRRQVIAFDAAISADREIARQDEDWRARGYERSGARLWQRADRTFTVRVVWRNRACRCSVTYTSQGLALR